MIRRIALFVVLVAFAIAAVADAQGVWSDAAGERTPVLSRAARLALPTVAIHRAARAKQLAAQSPLEITLVVLAIRGSVRVLTHPATWRRALRTSERLSLLATLLI